MQQRKASSALIFTSKWSTAKARIFRSLLREGRNLTERKTTKYIHS